MAERRELPVEHRENLRLARIKDQVVEPVVAVHDRGFLARGNVLRQPFDQLVHRLDFLQLGSLVLLRPARDLALEIVAGPAEILQPDRAEVDRVQQRDHPVHLVPDRLPLGLHHPRQRLVPQHAPFHAIHHVEHRADHRVVFAQYVRPGDRESNRVQRTDHAILAVDRMRRRQQLARRLSAQRVALAAGAEAIGRIRLPPLELLDLERPAEILDVRAQVRFELRGVEPMTFLDRLGADELFEHGSH